jgi:hypothetical protein
MAKWHHRTVMNLERFKPDGVNATEILRAFRIIQRNFAKLEELEAGGSFDPADFSGYNEDVAQTFAHKHGGVLIWKNDEPCEYDFMILGYEDGDLVADDDCAVSGAAAWPGQFSKMSGETGSVYAPSGAFSSCGLYRILDYSDGDLSVDAGCVDSSDSAWNGGFSPRDGEPDNVFYAN